MDFPLNEIAEAARQAVAIAEQNDRFRTSWGTDPTVPGRFVMTQGVAALSLRTQALMVFAVRTFSDFTEDNDPHGWHDFGAFTVPEEGGGVRLYWKIDLYDADERFGSEVPEDPAGTRRVLTILLPDEW